MNHDVAGELTIDDFKVGDANRIVLLPIETPIANDGTLYGENINIIAESIYKHTQYYIIDDIPEVVMNILKLEEVNLSGNDLHLFLCLYNKCMTDTEPLTDTERVYYSKLLSNPNILNWIYNKITTEHNHYVVDFCISINGYDNVLMETARRKPITASAFAVHILKERWVEEEEAILYNNIGCVEYLKHFFC